MRSLRVIDCTKEEALERAIGITKAFCSRNRYEFRIVVNHDWFDWKLVIEYRYCTITMHRITFRQYGIVDSRIAMKREVF